MDNQTKQFGQENFSLPHDVVPLPSGGIFYKNKKSSIKVGYLTASDENILMGGGNDITTNLLRTKIYEPDLRIEDLLTNKEFKTTVSLEQLSIKNGEKPNNDGTFTVTLPKSQTSVRLKVLTWGELNELTRIYESYPQNRVVPKVTLRLQKQIVEIDGVTDLGQIARFVEQMPILDSKFIKKFLDDNEPRLDLTRTITAPSGEKLTVNVGFGADFFRPFF